MGQIYLAASSRGQCTPVRAYCPNLLAGTLACRMNERTALLGSDVQSRRPATVVSLSRVGVTGVEKVIRIRAGDREQLFYAEL